MQSPFTIVKALSSVQALTAKASSVMPAAILLLSWEICPMRKFVAGLRCCCPKV